MTYNICGIARKLRLQFKIFLLIGMLLGCAVATWAEAPEVFLYYDENYGFNPDGWGDWKSTKKIEDAVIAELDAAKIASVVGNADEFLAYMEENPEGVIVSPIVVPEIVYTIGMKDDSPMENFLFGGGVLIYSGDTPFYAVGKKDAPGQKVVPRQPRCEGCSQLYGAVHHNYRCCCQTDTGGQATNSEPGTL